MRLTATGLAAVRGQRAVFRDVSFSIGPGDLLAVIGPNGAGKSTLLRIVAGLLRPSAGTVVLGPGGEGSQESRIHYLGHLDALKPGLTLRQNLDHWRRLWRDGDVDAALGKVGLVELADLPAAVLSAGQRRRGALARLLMTRRPLWLLDEPANALDAAAEANLGHLIEAHLAGGGVAIAATHRALPAAPAATLALGAA